MDDSHYITLDAVDYTDTTIPLPPNSFVAQLLNPDLPNWTPTPIFAHSDPAQLYEPPSFLNVSDIGNPLPQSTRLDANDSGADIICFKDEILHQLIGGKGGAQLGLNGFLYTHDRLKKLSSGRQNRYWQCKLKADCDIRCKTHLHESTPTSLAVVTVQSKLKQQARSDEVTRTVVRQASRGMEPVVLANLPTILNMKHQVRRERSKLNHHPVNSTNATDIIIPDHYKVILVLGTLGVV